MPIDSAYADYVLCAHAYKWPSIIRSSLVINADEIASVIMVCSIPIVEYDIAYN